MKYALVSTRESSVKVWVHGRGSAIEKGQDFKETALEEKSAPVGTILNVIAYDGKAEYTPPDGMRVALVSDDAQIGDIGYEEKQE